MGGPQFIVRGAAYFPLSIEALAPMVQADIRYLATEAVALRPKIQATMDPRGVVSSSRLYETLDGLTWQEQATAASAVAGYAVLLRSHSHLNQYRVWALTHNAPPLPVDLAKLQAFILHNVLAKYLNAPRQRNYVSALKTQVIAWAGPVNWAVTPEQYSYIHSFIIPNWAKMLPNFIKQAEVIDLDTVYKLYKCLDLGSNLDDVRFWAMFTVGVFTSTRGHSLLDGMFAMRHLQVLHPGHVTAGRHGGGFAMWRHLPKTDQEELHSEQMAATVVPRLPPGYEWACPATHLERWLAASQRSVGAMADQVTPVFCTIQGTVGGGWMINVNEPWSREAAQTQLRARLTANGCPYANGVTMHSPRHTGYTIYADMRLPKPDNEKLGGWASSGSSDGYDHSRAPATLAVAVWRVFTDRAAEGTGPTTANMEQLL